MILFSIYHRSTAFSAQKQLGSLLLTSCVAQVREATDSLSSTYNRTVTRTIPAVRTDVAEIFAVPEIAVIKLAPAFLLAGSPCILAFIEKAFFKFTFKGENIAPFKCPEI